MSKRILIVDDSALILAAAKHALASAGYDVVTREGVEEMVAGGTDDFDLLLVDVQMPELYGDDVAGVLRNVRGLKTPIYLFSTLPVSELAERANEAGVDGYISKDSGIDHLVERVRAILG